jgi:hypothetical protein
MVALVVGRRSRRSRCRSRGSRRRSGLCDRRGHRSGRNHCRIVRCSQRGSRCCSCRGRAPGAGALAQADAAAHASNFHNALASICFLLLGQWLMLVRRMHLACRRGMCYCCWLFVLVRATVAAVAARVAKFHNFCAVASFRILLYRQWPMLMRRLHLAHRHRLGPWACDEIAAAVPPPLLQY